MADSLASRGQRAAPDFSPIRGKRALIALSGGADSVALAVMLAEARAEYDLTLLAAHVDHGIRPESGQDAEFCRALCRRLDIPLRLARIDVPAEARRSHKGLETAARDLRRRALERFREEAGADLIVLAHHMDDQAETVLMHLFRGAGVEGLCGMRTFDAQSRLYRPLLLWRKAELSDYLLQRGFSWREDSTNRVADNPRNALRLNAIPEIERFYPQVSRAVARCALTLQAENDLVAQLTRAYLDAHYSAGGPCAWLELEPMPHPAILRRALLACCPSPLDWEQVNALEGLCSAARGKLDIDGDHFAERTGRRLYFVPRRLPPIQPVPLALDGETRLEGICSVTARPCDPVPVRDDPMRQVLDPAVLRGAVLRTRREGDRICPLGGGDKLLSDWFIDRKLDRPLRDMTPLVAVGNRVHWICGHAISRQAALKGGDDRAVMFTLDLKR